jgi:hypothetical protein
MPIEYPVLDANPEHGPLAASRPVAAGPSASRRLRGKAA